MLRAPTATPGSIRRRSIRRGPRHRHAGRRPDRGRALGAVLGQPTADGDPCLIGSVKTNIGHLEAAAGVAGLIKTALALKHREIPANLHYHEPNPDIPFDALRLKVPCATSPGASDLGPVVAGVNSFGFGGSNAHSSSRPAPSRPPP